MALTTTEEAQTRALIEQNAALLSLAASEPTIISKLAATKASLSDLPPATVKNNTDLFLVRQGTEDKSITGALAGGDAAYVSYMPAGVGAIETTVQDKLLESLSVGDRGAVANGIADDTTAVLAADDNGYAKVTGPSVIALGATTATTLQSGLIGETTTAEMADSRVDKPTVAIYSTTVRPSRAKVKSLKITGNTADTVNDYSDLSTVSEYSHYIENHLETVGSGVNVSYGPATMGSYAGSISADPGWEDQPLRCSVGATVAFNNVKTTSWLGYEVFCANHSRVVGNGVWNSTASAQHGYRFTGYPGGPNQFNAAAANTARLVQNGLSVQTSTRFNSLSGFTTETPTVAGLNLIVNNDKPSWHHTNNFLQGVSYQGTHGVYAAKPQYNHIQHIVDSATTFGVHFDNTGTYGANKGNLLDAVVTNSAEGASINSSQNIIRLITSNLTSRGLVVAGSGNIIDFVVDRSGSFALQMSGSNNQLRISTTQTAATVDLSINGSSNLVQCMLGGSITVSGNDNKFSGCTNLTGSTSIANTGARNDFAGISNASGIVYTAGTGAVTDASGEITVTTPTRPTMTGVSYVAVGQIYGTTLAGHTANYVGLTGATGIKFRIYNAAGAALGAGVSVILVVQYGPALNPQP